MSVVDDVRSVLGMPTMFTYHCWACDANYRTAIESDECANCGSADVRLL